jgi:hypothetical protein
MTREEVEAIVADNISEIRIDHIRDLQLLNDRIAKLEGSIDHLRKNFATRLTKLNG